jgi:carboxymethylenebutenolidase
MGNTLELVAADGHRLSAYHAAAKQTSSTPVAAPGIVVIQEIFGVTSHIRDVVDTYAAAGFDALAPALFDRVERGVDVPYTDMGKGIGYMQQMNNDLVMLDLGAALAHLPQASKHGMVGYCWGGTLAYLAAARLPIAAAVAYYGGGIDRYLDEKPRCPVMFHYGEKDAHIPQTAVAKVKAAFPQGQYYIYAADHGFNCADRGSYEPASAKLALERSLEFLHRQLG